MMITLQIEERDVETIMHALEAQAAKAKIEAAQGKRNAERTSAYTKRLCRINSALYAKILEAHEFLMEEAHQ